MKIAVLTNNNALIDNNWLQKLSVLGEVEYVENAKNKTENELVTILANADAAVIGWGAPLLPKPSVGWKLRYVCNMTGELKRMVPAEYFTSNILVSNWGDAYSFATAEGAVALLFSVLKEIPKLDTITRKEGKVSTRPEFFATLYRTRFGIYGLSSIGKLVAEYVKPFGARISFYDPTIDNFPDNLTRYGSLEELFANNDIVSIHAGLNNYTRSSVDYSLLSKLPYGGILINTARGPIVVEKDLGKILMEGKIRAGIDVSEYESDFRLSPYMSCPNTTITSHAISKIGSLEKTILQEIAFDNLGRFAKSEKPVHVVTMRRYEMMT